MNQPPTPPPVPTASLGPGEVDPRTLPPPAWPPAWPPGPTAGPPNAWPPAPTPGPPNAGAPLPQAGWPPVPPPFPPQRPQPPSPLPTASVEYQQLLRTPRHRWWKPLLTLLLFAAMTLVAEILITAVLVLIALLRGVRDIGGYLTSLGDTANFGPTAFAYTNATLVVLIPIAMLSRWIVYGQRPRFLSSVVGGLRWRWMARCALITFPVTGVYVAISTVAGGTAESRPPFWVVLVLLTLFTTPLQCAAEEYVFRGFILQTVGAWFRLPWLSLLVGTVPAVALFALAHTSPDPLLLAQLGIFALSCVVITWRTGGLEGGIMAHTANNVIALIVNVTYGGWSQTFIDSSSTGSVSGVLSQLVTSAVIVGLVLRQAKRAGVQRTYQPGGLKGPTDRVSSVPIGAPA